MKIGIDIMGSDQGPAELVKAVQRFVSDYDAECTLYGDIEACQHIVDHPKIKKVITTQIMEMEDGPLAIRRKKDASMVVALEDCIAGKTDGIVSAGSTGALLSAGVLLSKMLPNMDRPALMAIIPNLSKTATIFLDVGANSENTPEQLVQFAILGNVYSKSVLGNKNPRVALLNIGSEAKKGDETHIEAFAQLSKCGSINFLGNCEGRDILNDKADVIVTDGFSGNIALKTVEGTVSAFSTLLKKAVMANLITKIGGALLKKSLKAERDHLDYQKHGGALLAGCNHAIIKAHGSSNQEAFYHAIRQCAIVIQSDAISTMKKELL